MKILSIGNSFSQDAQKWLHKLARLNGFNVETANLYIGGCSLEKHWNNVVNDNEHYVLELNGSSTEQKISISKALKMEEWDIVTLQQVSNLSGLPKSYQPYLLELAKVVREALPDTKLYFHQTWAYESDSTNCGFLSYNNDQAEMFRCIKEASEKAAETVNAEIIPTGTIIQTLRDTVPEFDYKNGGLSLCRDGLHLSLDYGRFAAAATWLHTITGQKIRTTDFEDFNPNFLKKILDVVNEL